MNKKNQKNNDVFSKLERKKQLLEKEILKCLFDDDIDLNTRIKIFRKFGSISYGKYIATGVKRLDELVIDLVVFESKIVLFDIIESDIFSNNHQYLCEKYDIIINPNNRKHNGINDYFYKVCERYNRYLWRHLFKNKYLYSVTYT
jgi:hypothetical protein